jgi:hypothetical protein
LYIRHLLAVDLVGLADPAVNVEYFVDLHIVRLESPVGNDGPHVEFTLAFCASRELIGCFLDCGLSSQAVKAEKVVARELNGIFKDLQADSTAHLLI